MRSSHTKVNAEPLRRSRYEAPVLADRVARLPRPIGWPPKIPFEQTFYISWIAVEAEL